MKRGTFDKARREAAQFEKDLHVLSQLVPSSNEVPTLLVVADRRVRSRLEHPRGCRDIEGMLKPWLH